MLRHQVKPAFEHWKETSLMEKYRVRSNRQLTSKAWTALVGERKPKNENGLLESKIVSSLIIKMLHEKDSVHQERIRYYMRKWIKRKPKELIVKKTAVATVTLFSTPKAAQHNKASVVSLKETG